jgi:hypothetical protein
MAGLAVTVHGLTILILINNINIYLELGPLKFEAPLSRFPEFNNLNLYSWAVTVIGIVLLLAGYVLKERKAKRHELMSYH